MFIGLMSWAHMGLYNLPLKFLGGFLVESHVCGYLEGANTPPSDSACRFMHCYKISAYEVQRQTVTQVMKREIWIIMSVTQCSQALECCHAS